MNRQKINEAVGDELRFARLLLCAQANTMPRRENIAVNDHQKAIKKAGQINDRFSFYSGEHPPRFRCSPISKGGFRVR